MNKPTDSQGEEHITEAAWERFSEKVKEEPVNPVWQKWENHDWNGNAEWTAAADASAVPAATAEHAAAAPAERTETAKRSKPRWTKGRKWTAAVAGTAAAVILLSTPLGSTAMASLLNQFRMEKPTIVQEEDLRSLFYAVAGDGTTSEAINRFGEFTISNGTLQGELPLGDVSSELGFEPVRAEFLPETLEKVYVSPSQRISMKMDVGVINDTMKKLGAETLMPQSVDGREVTLDIPETVSYNLYSEKNGWASLMQSNVPVVTVDPGVDVKEALQAILDFPLLPEHLKTSLKQSGVLAGELPFPVFAAQGNTDQVQIAATTVMLQTQEYGGGDQHSAMWIKNGQLFFLEGGTVFQTRDALIGQVEKVLQ